MREFVSLFDPFHICDAYYLLHLHGPCLAFYMAFLSKLFELSLLHCDTGSDMPSSKKPEERKAKKAKVSEVVKMKISDVKPWEHFDHVVMNLPASALEFLGMFFLVSFLRLVMHWQSYF